MTNEVFVNNREIACKAADGKSKAVFPDVCFTPPRTQASPRGIPVLYPNTAYAKDTANGSKTVIITKKQVVLKDKSYFKTSTGNEAGRADKGVNTRKIKGKAYFTSWSMNVFIEGYNVCRHMDLTTHNHGSQPANTPPWKYIDTKLGRKNCPGLSDKVKDECEPSKKEKKEFEKDQKRRNKRRKEKGKSKVREEMGWKDKHCTGLMRIKPYNSINDIKHSLDDAVQQIDDRMDDIGDILKNKAFDIAQDKIEKVAVRAGAKYLGSLFGGPLAPFLAVASTAITAIDGVVSAIDGGMEIYDAYQKYGGKLGDLKDVASSAKKQIERAKDAAELLSDKQAGTLSEEGKKKLEKLEDDIKEEAKEVANAQDAQALKSSCLRAMKCILTPYNHSSTNMGKKNPHQGGCCPGQTAHHLPPKAYFKDCKEKGKYKDNTALTVCASGMNQNTGSHGRLHDYQDKAASRLLDGNGDLSFDNAIEASVQAHKIAFPGSSCKPECIRAQLQNALKDCKNSKINPIDKSNGKL